MEVFLGGLLHNTASVTPGRQPQPDAFDFSDSTRRILLGALPARELLRTTRLIADRLASSARHTPSFTSWVTHPGGEAAADIPERSFARLEERLLKRLGIASPVGASPDSHPAPAPRAGGRQQPPVARRTVTGHATPSSAVHKKVKILMVDGQPENLLAQEATLSSLGQTVVRASSGKEALSALNEDEFAVVLLAPQMPGMDGYETAAQIKRRSRTRDIPIVFVGNHE